MFLIYLIGNKRKSLYKIGFVNKKRGVDKRMLEVQTGFPYKLEFFKQFESKFGPKLEKVLHRRFSLYKKCEIDGEPLHGEWFNLSDEDFENFEKICESTERNLEAITKDSTIGNIHDLL
jgi:hypothetical protein